MAKADEKCAVDECAEKVGRSGARGYCPFHYRRFAATGDPRLSARDLARAPKPCPVCGESYKPGSAESRSCRPCKKKLDAEYNRRWRERNPGYHSEYNKRWRAENADAYTAYAAEYRAKNRAVLRARYAEWEKRNPDHMREWRDRNRERAREATRRRRSRQLGVPSFEVSERDIRRMLARHRFECAYCGDPLGAAYHVDHVVPVSLGGSNGIGNLAPACVACNVSKHNWFLSEWRYRHLLGAPLKRRRGEYRARGITARLISSGYNRDGNHRCRGNGWREVVAR